MNTRLKTSAPFLATVKLNMTLQPIKMLCIIPLLFMLTACDVDSTDETGAPVVDGGNTNIDIDGDGVNNEFDAFPNDASETTDTDGDGTGDNADIDDNDNGLIEISSLEQLDWIRNDLTGSSLNDGLTAITSGCTIGCIGYELTQTLDFDTNSDGVMDVNDTYFDYDDDGSNNGWLPIGINDSTFSAIFEGNDYEIRNLYINRSVNDIETGGVYIGLFGYLEGTSVNPAIRNLGLTGELMDVTGYRYIGGLIGYNENISITASYTTGAVSGVGSYVGGLVGKTRYANITSSYSTGAVTGGANYTGGLIGQAYYSSILASYTTASVSAQYSTGGLIGETFSSSITASYATGVGGGGIDGGLVGRLLDSSITASYFAGVVDGIDGGLAGLARNSSITASYWATDISNQSEAIGSNEEESTVDAIGATLEQLQCPITENNTNCLTDETLYSGWNTIDHDGDDTTDVIAPWIFGDSDTLPTLDITLTIEQ